MIVKLAIVGFDLGNFDGDLPSLSDSIPRFASELSAACFTSTY